VLTQLLLGNKYRLDVLQGILGSKGDEAEDGWRKLHEELQDLYSSLNIIRMIKSGKIMGAFSALGGKTGMHERFWWRK
jgi:hypothetical protein